MAAEMKTARSSAKREVTRVGKIVLQRIVEKDQVGLDDSVEQLKDRFNKFTVVHNEYHATLVTDIEIDGSDTYFYAVQDNYIDVLMKANEGIHKPNVKRESVSDFDETGSSPDNTRDISRNELLTLLNLPKVELEVFDGNPLRYHQFISAFNVNVDRVCQDVDLKLSRLMQYTTGNAKEAIRGCQLVGGKVGYDEARSILEKRFGNKYLVTERIIKDLRHGKDVRFAQEMERFADSIKNASLVLTELNMLSEVDSQSVIIEIASRFPRFVRMKWKKRALSMKKSNDCYPTFKDFVEFVADVASDLNDPVYGDVDTKKQDNSKTPSKSTSNLSATTPSPTSGGATGGAGTSVHEPNKSVKTYAKVEPPCVLCKESHRLWYCVQFKAMKPVDRLRLVNQYKLCHNCLLASHPTNECGKRSVCSVSGCGKKHTMWIHCPDNAANESKVSNVSYENGSSEKRSYMPIVKVQVNGSESVLALLDSGSSTTFCSKDLVHRLGIKGLSQKIQLSTLNVTDVKQTEVVDITVTSECGGSLNMAGVYVINSIPVACSVIDAKSYSHFADIGPLPAYEVDKVVVDLLIGQDNADAFVPLDVRRGAAGEPFAIRTMFGWCINGQSPMKSRRSVVSNFVHSQAVEDDVARLWKIENEGLHEMSWSQQDCSVIKLWDEQCRLVDSHYELPIPWKDRSEPIPNNFGVAKSRLDSLFKRFEKDGLFDRYESEIEKLLNHEYAEVVPQEELYKSERVWYLPHHAVLSDKKPDKLRVVFDCASKFQGQSLNDRCLQGPDLVNKLLAVLVRFRQNSFAVQGDIEAMYNQVKIPICDRDALRFLWYKDGELTTLRMTSHLFGGVWCASSSTYALRRTVQDNDVSDLVKHTIEKSFYVDDCLSSIKSRHEAHSVINETPEVLRQGGFNLTKFVVNDENLLSEVAVESRAKEVRDLGPESQGRVLGVKWHILSDMFLFEVHNEIDDVISRRRMLSFVSMIFDPLGLLAPLILPGKLLFQEATRRKLSWDENISMDLDHKWKSWVQSLQKVSDLRIPRCIKPSRFDSAAIELHHFSDASLDAYGCCSYARCINWRGEISVTLIVSKCKVAPIKAMTIPRLELQGAVVAAKIDAFLRYELEFENMISYFWIDSEVVLKYIRNDSRRFHVFVANRIALIRELTRPEQWGHIQGKINPADFLTRGLTYEGLDKVRWLHGPDFLRDYKSQWKSSDVCSDLSSEDPEVKKSMINGNANSCAADVQGLRLNDQDASEDDPLSRIMKHYSSWYRMKRAVAWWIRLVRFLKGHVSVGPLSVHEIRSAGLVIIRKCQLQDFPSDLACLARNRPVKSSSQLRSLNPYLDSDGLICVGGRLTEANIRGKHPYILSARNVVSAAIVRGIHDSCHTGVEWVLSLVRREFWIIKGRPLIKRIIKSCVTCRRLYAKPCKQLMADLPHERVQPGKPVFTYVGIDIFGPFMVKFGRSEIKRYGCIFTCFGSRAVHIEKLDSLETDAFLNGFRRFIARRGKPEVIYSDNGTNLVGAEAELRKSMSGVSRAIIDAYVIKNDIVWKFIPPSAPHMGGVWERLIGVIKRVLKAILQKSVRLTDEILETIFCEAEAIVNNRPITKSSDDPSDLRALTPNHLLLARDGFVLPSGEFTYADIYRKKWRHVQHLADQFWRQWLKAYLPELQNRSRWCKSDRNVAIGDLVLICDEITPRCLWPLALVKEVCTGRDGLVRSVRLKTRSTELVRPITKIVLLEAAVSPNDFGPSLT